MSRLEARRKKLGLTRATLLLKFEEALKKDGFIHTEAAAKMRLDRIFNRRLRTPVSESTKTALAEALAWTTSQLEKAINLGNDPPQSKSAISSGKIPGRTAAKISRDLAAVKRSLEDIARRLEAAVQGKPAPTRQ